MIGKLCRPWIDRVVKKASCSYELQMVIDKYASSKVFQDENAFNEFVGRSKPDELDEYFSILRRKLSNDIHWRYGARRINDVASTVLNSYLRHVENIHGRYCEVGCGHANPYGMSAIMYINGAESAVCFDKVDIDEVRVSESLFDTLVECALFSKEWNFCKKNNEVFSERLRSFDLRELRGGGLRKGIESAPIEFCSSVFGGVDFESNSIDFISSWVVLEHVRDLDKSLDKMYKWLAPGGLAYHLIDLKDHRYYSNPEAYNKWSFLMEKRKSSENEEEYYLSAARASEIKKAIDMAGYEVLEWNVIMEQPPKEIRSQLHDDFKDLSDEDIETTSVSCVLKK